MTTIELSERWNLRSPDGATAVFEPGKLDAKIRLDFASRDEEEEIDTVELTLELSDSSGTRWRGQTEIHAWYLVLPAVVGESPVRIRYEEAAPASWREALGKPLLSGINSLWDERSYHPLDLGERRFEIRSKYQGPILDLVLWEDDRSIGHLLVRVRQLVDEESEFIAPFVFVLPLTELLSCFDEDASSEASS